MPTLKCEKIEDFRVVRHAVGGRGCRDSLLETAPTILPKCALSCAQKNVTNKTFFARFYLVPGLSPFELRVKCPYAPTPPPFT